MKNPHLDLVEGDLSRTGARLLHWIAEFGEAKLNLQAALDTSEPYNDLLNQAGAKVYGRDASWRSLLNSNEYLGYAVQAITEDWNG